MEAHMELHFRFCVTKRHFSNLQGEFAIPILIFTKNMYYELVANIFNWYIDAPRASIPFSVKKRHFSNLQGDFAISMLRLSKDINATERLVTFSIKKLVYVERYFLFCVKNRHFSLYQGELAISLLNFLKDLYDKLFANIFNWNFNSHVLIMVR